MKYLKFLEDKRREYNELSMLKFGECTLYVDIDEDKFKFAVEDSNNHEIRLTETELYELFLKIKHVIGE